MIFLWTTTKYGKIWLDGEAFRQTIIRRLPSDFYCQEVSFVGEQSLLNIYVILPDKDEPQKRLALIDKLEEFFKPLGIVIHVHWVRRAPDEYDKAQPLWKKPLSWGAAFGGAAAVANLGLSGLAWVIGSGLCSYIVAWLILSEDGNKLVAKFINDIKDFRR